MAALFFEPRFFNLAFGGSGRIRGTVTELGAPGAYRVRLFHRDSGQIVRETVSGADGAYRFDGIDPTKLYFAVAHDHGVDPLNAAIADLLTPEPMP